MAQRRMFSMQIVDTDAFLEMPDSSQLLYFHLNMRADDEGFIANPKRIMKLMGAGEDDMKVLISKRFILTFKSGIVVIKHWLIHNTIRMDRFKETTYLREKKALKVNENRGYTESGNQMATIRQRKLSKVKLSKVKLERTPSQIAKNFFENQEPAIQILLNKEIPESVVRQEIKKFVSYWTEPNKSGSKTRWELQKTFEISRRLDTWLNRAGIRPTSKTTQDAPKKKFKTDTGLPAYKKDGKWYCIENGEHYEVNTDHMKIMEK